MVTNMEDQGSYTQEEILTALVQDYRVIRFRYQHLNLRNHPIGWLDSIADGMTITYNFFAETKRIVKFQMQETEFTEVINFQQDRIKPYMLLRMPDGLFAYIPLGVFLMSTPVRQSDNGRVLRDIDGYDQSIILRQNKIDNQLSVNASDVVVDLIYSYLRLNGIEDLYVHGHGTNTTAIGGTGRTWDAGTPYSVIIQDLADMLGLASLHFNSEGQARIEEYVVLESRSIDFTYATDRWSVIKEDASETLDLFDIPNKWVLVRSQPDKTVLTATITNNDPNDPTSTVSRGRTIVDFRTDSDAADQAALNQQVRRVASEAAETFRSIEFSTALMPLHGETNTIRLEHGPLGRSMTLNEVEWNMTLKAGAAMTHRARRGVAVAELEVSV